MRFWVHRDDCAIEDDHQSQIEIIDEKEFEMEGAQWRQSEEPIKGKDEAKGAKEVHSTAAHQQQFTEVEINVRFSTVLVLQVK